MLASPPLPSPPSSPSPCATHLPNRRPPACMWLWTVCQRPALLPPVTMLRTLSLRLGPAPLPEHAPPPLSLAPGEGPAPPCPPLSTAPLGGTGGVDRRQRNTDRQEERTTKRGQKEEKRERDGRTDVQGRRAKSIISKDCHTETTRHFVDTVQPQVSCTQQEVGGTAAGRSDTQWIRQWGGLSWHLMCSTG